MFYLPPQVVPALPWLEAGVAGRLQKDLPRTVKLAGELSSRILELCSLVPSLRLTVPQPDGSSRALSAADIATEPQVRPQPEGRAA